MVNKWRKNEGNLMVYELHDMTQEPVEKRFLNGNEIDIINRHGDAVKVFPCR